MDLATAVASATSSGCSLNVGVGPGIALADQVQLAARHPPARDRDDAVGQRHHLRGGPVVALEPHHRGVGEAAREVQQVAGRGAGERVDGLVGVADDGQVVALAEPRVEHPLLQRGDVLVLVDDEAAVAVAELLATAASFSMAAAVCSSRSSKSSSAVPSRRAFMRLVSRVDGGDLGGVERDVAARPRRPPPRSPPG